MTADALLGALLSDSRSVVEDLLREPPVDEATLRAELADAVVRHVGVTDPAVPADWVMGALLAKRCEALLDRYEQLDPRGRKLVQVAVRYFAREEDGASDLGSAFGFDDDREVLDAVATALSLPPIAP